MRLERRIVGQNGAEIVKNAEAIVLLLHSSQDTYSLMAGPKNLVHQLFIECALRWPSVVSWDEKTKKRIRDVLESNISDDTSTFYNVSENLITNERKTQGNGKISFDVRDLKSESGSLRSINISGINDAIISVWSGEQALVASHGWGSEKRELMFYGAEILFGPGVSYQLRETVSGKREIDLGNSRIVEIDLTDLARKSLQLWRRHRAEPGEIILSAEVWEKLAEERSRGEKIKPSVN